MRNAHMGSESMREGAEGRAAGGWATLRRAGGWRALSRQVTCKGRVGVVLSAAWLVMLTAVQPSLAGSVSLYIPDTSAVRSETVWVPLYASDLTDSGVYSYSLIISFDSTFVEMLGISREGAIADMASWLDPVWNIVPGQDSLRVAGAGTEPLAGRGPFLWAGLRVLESAPADSGMFLGLHRVLLNEGHPVAGAAGGRLQITTAESGARAQQSWAHRGRVRVERLSPTAIRWHLPAGYTEDDTHGDAGDDAAQLLLIYDAFGEFVTSIEPEAAEQGITYTWDGRALDGRPVSGGVYFYQIGSGQGKRCGKVRLLR